ELNISEFHMGRVDYSNPRLIRLEEITKKIAPNHQPFSVPPKYHKSWIIELPSARKHEATILVPCSEFFIRCHGSSKHLIATIIESYKSDLSLGSFAKKIDCDEQRW